MRTISVVALLAIALTAGCDQGDPTSVPTTLTPSAGKDAGKSWVITTYYWDGEWVKLATWNASSQGPDFQVTIFAFNGEPYYPAFQIEFDNFYAVGDDGKLMDDFGGSVISSIWEENGGGCVGTTGETACVGDGMLTMDIAEDAGPYGHRGAELRTQGFGLSGELDVQIDFSVDASFHETSNAAASLSIRDENGHGAAAYIRDGRYSSYELGPGTWTLNRRLTTLDETGRLRITRTRVNGAGRVVESAAGSGSFDYNGWRTFSFTASRYADGTVTGQWERINHYEPGSPSDSKSTGVITCLTIVGDEAWIGGYATTGAYSNPPKNEVFWRVKDNGPQGAGSPADQMSTQAVERAPGDAADFCAGTPGRRFYDIEAGNITVKQ